MNQDGLLSSYYFHLPPELIAQTPAVRRDSSRLMVLDAGGGVSHEIFSSLPRLLRKGDLLVRNNARVIPARLLGKRAGGGVSELLLVRPAVSGDRETWLCLARPASHLKPGKQISFGDGKLVATILEKLAAGETLVEFSAKGEAFRDAVAELGMMPLPPYIERPGKIPTREDVVRYQTTYAKKDGAVAAPTAGLHFTPEIDSALTAAGVDIREVTLLVGPGTFRPIKADKLEDHAMDAERYSVEPEVWDAVLAAKNEGRRVVAVGTTTVRTLESIAAAAPDGESAALQGWTRLFIKPGHKFRVIDGLVTNFHLPGSSLLVLISALAGRERIMAAYAEAVRERYRFYSYGDAMLIWRP